MSNQPEYEQSDALQAGVSVREFVIRGVLGQGGFGITYIAHDTVFDRPVAIKEFLPSDIARRVDDVRVSARAPHYRAGFEWGLDEFLREARIIDRLDHPNVVRVRSFFRDNDTAYLVMEHVEGPTLREWLETRAPPSWSELCPFLEELADGLAYVHSQGCLHRDIKPDNVILRGGRTDSPVLIDFGAARKAIAERTRSASATVSAGYTPLEQYSGFGSMSAATDLYAFCAVAYRCITGEEPVAATDRVAADTLARLADCARDRFPQALLESLDAGLALRVTERPDDLDGVRAALQSARAAGWAGAPPVAAQARRSAERDRNRKTLTIAFTKPDESLGAPRRAGPDAALPNARPTAAPHASGAGYPKPLAVGLLAMIAGAAATWRLADSAHPYVLEQALLAVPLAAYLATWLVQQWLAKPGFSRVLVLLATCIGIAVIAVSICAAVVDVYALGTYETDANGFFVDGLGKIGSLAAAAAGEIVAFAAGLALLHWVSGRLPRVGGDKPRRLLEPAAVFPALLLAALSAKVALGFEWPSRQPARTVYTVAADGSGDFATVDAALAEIRRLRTDDRVGLTVQIKAGIYRELLVVDVPVAIVGEQSAVLEAPGGGPAVEIRAPDTAPRESALRGLTVRGKTTDGPLVVIAAGAKTRIENNTFSRDADAPATDCVVVRGADDASPAAESPSADVHGNVFAGSCGLRLTGRSLTSIRGNEFQTSRGVALAVADASSATVVDNRFPTRSPSIVVDGNAQATIREGTVRLAEARGAARLAFENVALVNGDTCIVAEDSAAVTIMRAAIDCAVPAIDASGSSAVTVTDSSFKFQERLGENPSWYVRDSGDRISFVGTAARR